MADETEFARMEATDEAHKARQILVDAARLMLRRGLHDFTRPGFAAAAMGVLDQGEGRVEITVSIPDGTCGAFAIGPDGKRKTLFVLTPAASTAKN